MSEFTFCLEVPSTTAKNHLVRLASLLYPASTAGHNSPQMQPAKLPNSALDPVI